LLFIVELAVPALLAFLGSLVLTPICRWWAHRTGFVAAPKEDRWHKRPTALFGGISIAAVTLVVGLTLGPHPSWPLLIAGLAIAGLGLLDDLLSLKASTKLVGQITVAALLLFFGYRLGWMESMIGDAMLTLFWIVAVTNAFNLLDNMDGLCAGTAVIAGLFLILGADPTGPVSPATMYLAALIGATAGFLVYNVHPASIFMGDTGSLFIGLNLAALTLIGSPETRSSSGLLSVMAVPVLPLLIPIFDTALVTSLRVLSGRSVSQGGRDHASHRLVAVGLSEPRAVTTLWMLAALGGGVSLLLRVSDIGVAVIGILTLFIAMAIFGVFLARVRVYEDSDVVATGETITPVVANFMYKRRVAEILLDLCLIPLAYYTAYRLRFEGTSYTINYVTFIQSMPVMLGAQMLALFAVGGYRGTWRHFGLMDAVVFAKGVVLGTVGAVLIVLFAYRFENYSRSVFVIDAALLLLLLIGTRASFRLVGEFVLRRRAIGRRCVIYGIGGASLSTIREAFGPNVALKIVGFVEDDAAHRNIRLGGYSVVGGYDQLLGLIEEGAIDCVVLNTHLVDAKRLQALEDSCAAHDIELLRLHVDLKPISRIPAAS
jgi:UDP-GlcNAc:undecaprenyl-phosphate GlcNAc-1-phosphate transferase